MLGSPHVFFIPNQEECDSAAKAFRVYYSKSQLGPDPMDYLIDQ
jgi:hypothetical protein